MSTFTIGATVAVFKDKMIGAQQEVENLQKITLGVTVPNVTEWMDFVSLVTTKYHVHVPMSGVPIIDVVRGPGEGALVIDSLVTTTALLVELKRGEYLLGTQSQGIATFLITAAVVTWLR